MYSADESSILEVARKYADFTEHAVEKDIKEKFQMENNDGDKSTIPL